MTFWVNVLVNMLISLMPTNYQRESMKAALALFLEAEGKPLPQQCETKSPSALSRFYNHYRWPVRKVIRSVRRKVLAELTGRRKKGRRPILRAIIDVVSLEKRGKFEGLRGLIHVLNKKRGLHLAVLYLEVDGRRTPWAFRPWRGKGTASPAELTLKLLRTLPPESKAHYKIRVLADAGLYSVDLLKGVRRMGFHAIVGIPKSRKLRDGRTLRQLRYRGEPVMLRSFPDRVCISWVWLLRDGKWVQRYVLSTKAMTGSHIARWGKRRWAIEGFFEVAKHRFGLHRFGQATKAGVYRYLVLCFIAFLLAHRTHLALIGQQVSDWGMAARLTSEKFFQDILVTKVLKLIHHTKDILETNGVKIKVERCKM